MTKINFTEQNKNATEVAKRIIYASLENGINSESGFKSMILPHPITVDDKVYHVIACREQDGKMLLVSYQLSTMNVRIDRNSQLIFLTADALQNI